VKDIRPVNDAASLEWALAEIETYFVEAPAFGTPESDRFDVLASLIEAYEERRFHVGATMAEITPLEALRQVMEANGYTQADLAEILGSRSRASEILSGRREMSLGHIQVLRDRWGVPADVLIPRLSHAH